MTAILRPLGRALTIMLALVAAVQAANEVELKEAFERIADQSLDTAGAREVRNFTLTHHDFELVLDSGTLAFFQPIMVDSLTRYAAFFRGTGRIRFAPRLPTEQDQLRRFFETDSLDRSFSQALVAFGPGLYAQLRDAGEPSGAKIRTFAGEAEGMLHHTYGRAEPWGALSLLHAIQEPSDKPYLLVDTQPEGTDRIKWSFRPHSREEISLSRSRWELGKEYLETVCSYSQYAQASYANLNGLWKEVLEAEHFDLDGSINGQGFYRGTAKGTFGVVRPAQAVGFSLHTLLAVTSVTDSAGTELPVFRNKDGTLYRDWHEALFVFFPRRLEPGEKITLTFAYEGHIAEREVGEFYVTAGAMWYPRTSGGGRSTFSIRCVSPKDFPFVASGELVEQRVEQDSMIGTWRIEQPEVHASFAIGAMKKYGFDDEEAGHVDVYYSRDLHNKLAQALLAEAVPIGKSMEKQVAQDVINAIRILSFYYGKPPYESMAVSEIMSNHGQSFPGLLHLGLSTWINSDPWGDDIVFRAHETAHQWWGIAVSPATYHDTWLSEGFAEYSALLCLQAVKGNDAFLDRLKRYREDIFSNRKYILGLSGEEAGPIIQGYRTSSSKTQGDYSLIIYRKGAFVLHMIRNLLMDLSTMGEERFLAMMREFYESNRGREVSTDDFRAVVEKYAGGDMGWFFRQWVYGTELPEYQFSYTVEPAEDGTFTVVGRVQAKNVGEDFRMVVPFEIEFSDKQKVYARHLVQGSNYEFRIEGMWETPKKVRMNPLESVLAKVDQ